MTGTEGGRKERENARGTQRAHLGQCKGVREDLE